MNNKTIAFKRWRGIQARAKKQFIGKYLPGFGVIEDITWGGHDSIIIFGHNKDTGDAHFNTFPGILGLPPSKLRDALATLNDTIFISGYGNPIQFRPYRKENPMKKKRNISIRKNSAIRISANPEHFPRTKRGRPRKAGRPSVVKPHAVFSKSRRRPTKVKWWILDLYNASGKLKNTLIGQGTHANATADAQSMVSGHVSRVELSGPYSSKPTKSSPRK